MAFDPITLIGAAISAAGSALSGMASAAAYREQQRIGRRNAEVAAMNAERAQDRAQVEQMQQDFQATAMLGQQASDQGASGLGGRSQALARKSARDLARVDALTIRQAGDLETFNFRIDEQNQRASAAAAGRQAGFSLLGGFLGAGSSLIGGFKGPRARRRFEPQGALV